MHACKRVHLHAIHGLLCSEPNHKDGLGMEDGFMHAVDAALSHKDAHAWVPQDVVLGRPVDDSDVGPKVQGLQCDVACMSKPKSFKIGQAATAWRICILSLDPHARRHSRHSQHLTISGKKYAEHRGRCAIGQQKWTLFPSDGIPVQYASIKHGGQAAHGPERHCVSTFWSCASTGKMSMVRPCTRSIPKRDSTGITSSKGKGDAISDNGYRWEVAHTFCALCIAKAGAPL